MALLNFLNSKKERLGDREREKEREIGRERERERDGCRNRNEEVERYMKER